MKKATNLHRWTACLSGQDVCDRKLDGQIERKLVVVCLDDVPNELNGLVVQALRAKWT